MTFQDKIKTSVFWKNTFKIASLFFILLIIISLLFNSFPDILNFDIPAVKEKNFSNGKWRQFVLTKVVVSLLYSMFVTSKNMK